MSWVRPLQGMVIRRAPRRDPVQHNERPIQVGAVIYPTMTLACKALGCSTTKLYNMLDRGEAT